jgi:hypothetical protein
MELTFDRVLAILGIVLAIVLVVLDKAGKLKGPFLLVLLGAAALMMLPLALGNSWVRDTPWGMLKFSKGMLMFSVVAICYSTLAVWISAPSVDEMPRPPERTLVEGREPLASQTPFFVAVNISMSASKRTDYQLFVASTHTKDAYSIYPVNTTLNMTITNTQSHSSVIKKLMAEVKTKNGDWVKMILIPTDIYEIYFTSGNLKQARLAGFDGVDKILTSKPLSPNEPVTGWAFFQYPKGYDEVGFTSIFRVLLSDAAGIEFTSQELTAENKQNEGLGGAALSYAGVRDLSKAELKYFQ